MLLAIYAAGTFLPMVMIVYMVIYLTYKKKGHIMLCTECQQCKAVCPMLSQGSSPMNIIIAAKSGQDNDAIKKAALTCEVCRKCQKACPRGLAPYVEVEKWRAAHNACEREQIECRLTAPKKTA